MTIINVKISAHQGQLDESLKIHVGYLKTLLAQSCSKYLRATSETLSWKVYPYAFIR